MHNILQRKLSKQILSGERFDWDYNQRQKISQLKLIQSDLFIQEKFTEWLKLDNEIKDLQTTINSSIFFEMAIIKLAL